MIAQTYVGAELALFAQAKCWKRYVSRTVAPFLGLSVLEVGAGIGTTTEALCRASHTDWLCLEPDAEQVAAIDDRIADGSLPRCCRSRLGTLSNLSADERFDSILYMDVLEHIEHDAAEIARAAEHLAAGGHLVVLGPAHQSLYAPFDRAIGHFRRYNRETLAAAAPAGLQCVRLCYLDSVGLGASLANRLLLRQSMPTARQIAIWDRWMVRTSQFVDPLLGYRLGKSVLGVWRKAA